MKNICGQSLNWQKILPSLFIVKIGVTSPVYGMTWANTGLRSRPISRKAVDTSRMHTLPVRKIPIRHMPRLVQFMRSKNLGMSVRLLLT